MDVRLTAEQQQLRDAAAKLADDLGPGSVQDLADDDRIARLDKQIEIDRLAIAAFRRGLRCGSGHRRRGIRPRIGGRAVSRTGAGRRSGPACRPRRRWVDDRRGWSRDRRAGLSAGVDVGRYDGARRRFGRRRRGRGPDQGHRRRHRNSQRRRRTGLRRRRTLAGTRPGHHVGGPGRHRPGRAHPGLRLRENPRAVRASRSAPIRPSRTCSPKAWP